jgi:mannose-6-phosphate isomerase-like protein (cupin superfamily)
MSTRPYVIREEDFPPGQWEQDVPGDGVRWRTLTSADRAPTAALTTGILEMDPGARLLLHHHAPPEVYYICEGQARVTLGTVEHTVGPGAALFIPGDLPHAIVNPGPGRLRLFYSFPVDSYHQVEYVMLE